MFKVSNIKVSIDGNQEEGVKKALLKKLGIPALELKKIEIIKKAIDARKKEDIVFNYTVYAVVKNQKNVKKHQDISKVVVKSYQLPNVTPSIIPPIIVGFGPAGMMAALALAKQGCRPLVFERGGSVDERVKAIDEFWLEGTLNEECNVQFGEGGAGTFSDGKLTARSKDEKAVWMLKELVEAGAPEAILYDAHPHIGTDVLRRVVKNIRNKIIALGGMIHFNTKVDGLWLEDGVCKGVLVNEVKWEGDAVILAIGHSAHDTFEALHAQAIAMEAKPFAVGVRVEHLQTMIDASQYGEYANHPALKSAEYRLVHNTSSGRGVYTFCMCPGGYVVPSSAQKNSVVTNGMSEFARNSKNANAAILVQVSPADFGNHPLDGVHYQRELEHKAFLLGGGNYKAPAQRIKDFLNNEPSTSLGKVQPSYALGVTLTNLQTLFSSNLVEALKEGIYGFEKQLPGFINEDAVLTGVETRSSSPLRINRNDQFVSNNVLCLYPCGEGAGYAGGIVSAGVDGLRCAHAYLEYCQGK